MKKRMFCGVFPQGTARKQYRSARARKGPGLLNTAPGSTNDACVGPASVSRARRARGKDPGPLNTAPASRNDTCVAPASVSCAPSARVRQGSRAPEYRACQHKRHLRRARQRFARPERAPGKGPGPLNTAPASTNDAVSRPPTFRAPRARARRRSRAPKYRACQHKRHVCRARQRFARPERVRQGSRAPKYRAWQHKRRVCRARQRFPGPGARARQGSRAP